MSVVDEAIADGVGRGRVVDHGVPVLRVELARDDGGRDVVAIFEDVEERAPLGSTEAFEAEVVEDEDVRLGEAA